MDAMRLAEVIGLVVASYLMGSLPFGYWVGKKVKGPGYDIRNHGSKNIGFSNVKRELGMKVALLVLLLDVAKALLPTLLGRLAGNDPASAGIIGGSCMIAAMFGHAKSFIFFLKEKHFSGGKGVACALGGFIALQPAIAGLAFLVFVIVLLIPKTRYISLGSMIASASTPLLAWMLGLQPPWIIIFIAVALMILFTHRRNIGRLVHGIEPKFTLRKGSDEPKEVDEADTEVAVAFYVHPMGWSDLRQSVLSIGFYWLSGLKPLRPLCMWLLSYLPVIENAEVTGIRVNDGRRVKIRTQATMFLPWMIKAVRLADDVDKGRVQIGKGDNEVSMRAYKRSRRLRKLLWSRIESNAVQARRCGLTNHGLGALFSTEYGGGTEIQTWADNRGLGITFENGGAFTAEATVQAVVAESPIPISEATIAVYGASGFIGELVARRLAQLCKHVVAIGRDRRKLKGFDETKVTISTDPADAYGCDIVVLLTSSADPIITLSNCTRYKKGAVFCDGAQPPDFDKAILKDHPEMEFVLVGCGVIEFLSDEDGIKSGLNWHFGKDEHGNPYFPACAAQLVLDALDGEDAKPHMSRGARGRMIDMDYYRERAEYHGLKVRSSPIREGEQFAGTEFTSN